MQFSEDTMICNMCGDAGFQEELFLCKICSRRLQHRYCRNLYADGRSAVDPVCEWCIHREHCWKKRGGPQKEGVRAAVNEEETALDSQVKSSSSPCKKERVAVKEKIVKQRYKSLSTIFEE